MQDTLTSHGCQRRTLRLAPLALAGLLGLPPGFASAQTTSYWDVNGADPGAGDAGSYIWNAGNSYWSADSAGGAATTSWTSGNIAAFSAGTDGTGFEIDIAEVQSVGGLKFEESGVLLTGGGLALSQAAAFDVFEAMTATLTDVAVTGAYSLAKTGKGTLVFAGTTSGTFTGDFIVQGGTVELNTTGPAATGAGNVVVEAFPGNAASHNPTVLRLLADDQIANTAHVTVTSRQYRGSLFDLNGHSETIGGLTINSYTGTNDIGVRTGADGVLTVAGDIFLHNSRNGSTGNFARDVLITGTGSRSVVAADSGVLDLGGAVRTITVSNLGTGTLYPDSDATIETIIRNGGIEKAGDQMLILSGTNTYLGGTTVSAGTLRIGAGGTTGSVAGNILNNSALEFNRSNTANHLGDITGTGSLAKLGTGTLVLTGANSYSGLTSVLNGTLEVEKIGRAYFATDTNIGRQAVVYLGATTANVGFSYIGAGESTDKIFRLTGTTGTVTFSASGTGALVLEQAFLFQEAASRDLVLSGTSTAANTIEKGITDAPDGGLTSLKKTGTGTWILEGENTYTGVTTVSEGILRLEGDATLASEAIRMQGGTFEIAGNLDLTLEGDPSVKVSGSELSGFYYSLMFGGGPAGSAATVSIATGRKLTLQSHVGYLASGDNLGASITGGTLDLGNELRVFVIGNSANTDAELTISSAIVGGAEAVLMKAGTGRLVLTQGLSLTRVQVNEGRLDLGGASNTVSGKLQVGFNNIGALHYSTANGSLSVGSGSFADTLDVGVTINEQGYAYNGTVTGTMDLRGSLQFTADVGQVRFGIHTTGLTDSDAGVPVDPSFNGGTTPASPAPNSTSVYLATNNTITARTSFTLADARSASVGGIHLLEFGEGLNLVKTPQMYIGHRKGSGQASVRAGGTLRIQGLEEGDLTNLFVGYSPVNTGAVGSSYLDVTAGTLVADLRTLIIGFKGSGSGGTGGTITGALLLGASQENDVTVSEDVTIGYIAGTQASATSYGWGTLSLAGGTFNVGGNVLMAVNASSGSGASNANLTSTGELYLTGGTFTIGGNLTTTADALGRSTAIVSLNGGTLDMTGGSIGGPGAAITLQANAGTLRSVAEFNNGAVLVKKGNGVLRMDGTNTYTGGTRIEAGTLEVLSASRIGATASGTTEVLGTNAVLAGNGTVRGATTLTLGSIRPGDAGGNGHGVLALEGNVLLQAAPGSGSTITLGLRGATGVAELGIFTVSEIPDVYGFTTYSAGNGSVDHDILVVTGTLTWNEGTKLVVEDNGIARGNGLVFNLLDWTQLSGTFPAFSGTTTGGEVNDYLELPDLEGTGFYWDLSLLNSHGTIVMAPEPGRSALLFAALAALGFRRRRPLQQL